MVHSLPGSDVSAGQHSREHTFQRRDGSDPPSREAPTRGKLQQSDCKAECQARPYEASPKSANILCTGHSDTKNLHPNHIPGRTVEESCLDCGVEISCDNPSPTPPKSIESKLP